MKMHQIMGWVLVLWIFGAWTAQGESPRLLACLSVIESQLGEADREWVWDSTAPPGKHKRLAITLETDTKAQAIIIPWNAERTDLAPGWRPVQAALKSGQALRLPETPWLYESAAQSFRIQILVFAENDPTGDALVKLVAAMHSPNGSAQVRQAQAKKLRALADQCRTVHTRRPAPTPARVAGVFRGSFEWRKYATSTPFRMGQPVIMEYSSNSSRKP